MNCECTHHHSDHLAHEGPCQICGCQKFTEQTTTEGVEMPLHEGKSPGVVRKNIKEMIAAGHPQKQAVASAMREADASPRKPKKKGKR